MHPAITGGENIVVEKTLAENINFLDVLVYMKQNKFFAHRVIWKNKKNFVVKGDTHLKFERVRSEEVFGRVMSVTKGEKWNIAEGIKIGYFMLRGVLASFKWKIKKQLFCK